MKRVVLSIILASVVSLTFAQKSEVNEAKKAWGLFQVMGQTAALPKKLDMLKTALSHTDKAIADEKSKVMPEAWSYRALLASAIAISDTANLQNSEANVKIAQEAIAQTKRLDTKETEKDNLGIAENNVANAVRNAGVMAYNKKDFKTAYTKFTEATTLNPLDTAMYLNAGVAARAINDYPNTLVNFKKVISMNAAGSQQSLDLYKEMVGISLAQQKDTVAGLALLNEAIAKFPEDADLIKSQTQIYIDKGDAEKSEKMLNALATKEPNNANYQLLLGNIYFNQALKLQTDRNKIDAKKVKEYNDMTTKMTGLLDKSLPYYTKALSIDPKNVGALETLKTIYAFKNDTKNYEDIKKRLDALPKQ